MFTSDYNPSVPHLIIGGTTKAGTSSVFTYLAAHPQVCSATLKETRYFLDDDYPLERVVDPGHSSYATLYPAYEPGQVCVEATPDYLYSPGTADRLAHHLTDPKIVFLLREPVSRLVSWYRFAGQRDLIPAAMSFADYVRYQLDESSNDRSAQHFLALEQGRYSRYLPGYLKRFPNRVSILWFDRLRVDPHGVMTSLAEFAGIDAEFFDDFDFNVVNRTASVRNPRVHGKLVVAGRNLRRIAHRFPAIHDVLRAGKRFIAPVYDTFNRGARNPAVDIPPSTFDLLRDYYRDEPERLVKLTGERPPWSGTSP